MNADPPRPPRLPHSVRSDHRTVSPAPGAQRRSPSAGRGPPGGPTRGGTCPAARSGRARDAGGSLRGPDPAPKVTPRYL